MRGTLPAFSKNYHITGITPAYAGNTDIPNPELQNI